MKNYLIWISVLLLTVSFFSGCNSDTVEGFGRDLQTVRKGDRGLGDSRAIAHEPQIVLAQILTPL